MIYYQLEWRGRMWGRDARGSYNDVTQTRRFTLYFEIYVSRLHVSWGL